MNKQILIDVITDQRKTGLPRHFVPRSLYDKVQRFAGMKQILVLAGLRRTGKSTLLQEIRSRARQADYYINFDDERLVQFSTADFQLLLEVFMELYGEQKVFYFDEIQNIKGWERFVRRLHDYGYKVYVTGSNASMFSKELGTHLTGRYIQMELYPFSFHEYVQYKDNGILTSSPYSTTAKGKLKRLFRSYFTEGGIPEYVRTLEPEYLKSLYESVLYRDILVRYKISQERPIKELVYYLASNLGKQVSYNKLKDLIGVGSATTVSDYCYYLENSFLSFLINNYDRSVKRQMHSEKKLYWVDNALAHIVGFRFSPDRGRALENLVFVELKRQGQEIYFHRQKKECDFLLRKRLNIQAAIQVCSFLDQPETLRREKEGLIEAMEMHGLREGLILTEDEEKEETVSVGRRKCRILIQPVWKWLLQKFRV